MFQLSAMSGMELPEGPPSKSAIMEKGTNKNPRALLERNLLEGFGIALWVLQPRLQVRLDELS